MLGACRTSRALGAALLLAASLAACSWRDAAPKDAGAEPAGLRVEGTMTVSLRAPQGGPFPSGAQTYRLENASGRALAWEADCSVAWLVASPARGTVGASLDATVAVTIDADAAARLPIGRHTGRVQFRESGGQAERFPVVFDVEITRARASVPEAADLAARPGPDNTGPRDGSLLVASGSITVTTDGSVIEDVDVSGWISVQANDVTLRNFRVDATGFHYAVQLSRGFSGMVVEDGEIVGALSCGVIGSGFAARRLNIHDVGDDGFKPMGDAVIEQCWVHHMGTNPDGHADGVQIRNGSNYVIRGNNFDMPGVRSPNAPGPPYQSNAAISVDQGAGPVDGVLIEGNWLNGGNFTVYIDDVNGTGPARGVRLRSNRFGRDFNFGPLVNRAPDAELVDNRWDATGEVMDFRR